MTIPPAGWYDDPGRPGTNYEKYLRYWDGQRWTPHTHVMPIAPATSPYSLQGPPSSSPTPVDPPKAQSPPEAPVEEGSRVEKMVHKANKWMENLTGSGAQAEPTHRRGGKHDSAQTRTNVPEATEQHEEAKKPRARPVSVDDEIARMKARHAQKNQEEDAQREAEERRERAEVDRLAKRRREAEDQARVARLQEDADRRAKEQTAMRAQEEALRRRDAEARAKEQAAMRAQEEALARRDAETRAEAEKRRKEELAAWQAEEDHRIRVAQAESDLYAWRDRGKAFLHEFSTVERNLDLNLTRFQTLIYKYETSRGLEGLILPKVPELTPLLANIFTLRQAGMKESEAAFLREKVEEINSALREAERNKIAALTNPVIKTVYDRNILIIHEALTTATGRKVLLPQLLASLEERQGKMDGHATPSELVYEITAYQTFLASTPEPTMEQESLKDPAKLAEAAGRLRSLSSLRTAYKEAFVARGRELKQKLIEEQVQALPIGRLNPVPGKDEPYVAALREAGIATIGQVLSRDLRYRPIEGVSPRRANAIREVAATIHKDLMLTTGLRFDLSRLTDDENEVLKAISCYLRVQALEVPADLKPALDFFGSWTSRLTKEGGYYSWLTPGLREAMGRRREEILALATQMGWDEDDETFDHLAHFEDNPQAFYEELEATGLIPSGLGDHGQLSEEQITAIDSYPLDARPRNLALRRYQAFGAKFALHQKKVIIGDEMGLGKTIEALATLDHLARNGHTHFLVVCPLAVVENWRREAEKHFSFTIHIIHGNARDDVYHAWRRSGGLGITTYDTLRNVQYNKPPKTLASVVVDEAHYIKNPTSQRSIATVKQILRSEYAILLSGTPLENRIEEFTTLASYVQPELTIDATAHEPTKFRKQVAPAYLRRNQEDVLKELPELIEVEEWLPMSDHDLEWYRAAADDAHWMRLRRAATLAGPKSAKVMKTVELCKEAIESGRKVLIFTYFLDTLEVLKEALKDLKVFGPMDGSSSPLGRQGIIDEYASHSGGAVLLAQITSGGTGLNIQAASTIIIMEPQLKPSIEAQAIARAHRMGQVRTVQVHRLLSMESVDETVHAILNGKQMLFDSLVRVSEAADSSAAAKATDEVEVIDSKKIMAMERERLGITDEAIASSAISSEEDE